MEINKIICGDSAIILKEFPDNYIDLVITSPPYDNQRKYLGFVFDFETISFQLSRVLKDDGVIVWVVNDQIIDGSESLTSFKQAIYFVEKCGLNLHDTMIWAKNFIKFPENVRYHQCFEYMFVFSKGKPKTFNPLKDRPNVYIGQVPHGKNRTGDDKFVKNDKTKICGEYGMRTNIWICHNESGTKYFKLANKVDHPAVFPDSLAKDHILSWSNPGDLILDPFSGSGTTCRMAKVTNRNFIGIDISKEYCELAEKSLYQIGDW